MILGQLKMEEHQVKCEALVLAGPTDLSRSDQ